MLSTSFFKWKFVWSINARRIELISQKELTLAKQNASKECDICHYCYLISKNFNYDPYHYNECHDLMQKTMIFNDVVIVSIKGGDYRTNFWYMSKRWCNQNNE